MLKAGSACVIPYLLHALIAGFFQILSTLISSHFHSLNYPHP